MSHRVDRETDAITNAQCTQEPCGPATADDPRAQAAEDEREQFRAAMMRAQADLESYRKRSQLELTEERTQAVGSLVRELLPALDNLQRALDTAEKEGERQPLVHGVKLIQKQLLEVLARFGVVPIDAVGQPFDPHLHDAVLQQPRDDVPPGTIAGVMENGYRLHDRLLRPAKVVVAAPQ
jgi:molecular chaperone GrpE